jgi:hypothetical protein
MRSGAVAGHHGRFHEAALYDGVTLGDRRGGTGLSTVGTPPRSSGPTGGAAHA